MSAAPTNDRALNWGATSATRLTRALINVEPLLHFAVPIRCGVVVDRGAASVNRFAQHTHNRKVQRVELRWAQPICRGKRMDFRAPERLIGVDVADPNDAALIEQEALDPCCTVRNQ
jgi:hypothetical protein